MQTVVRSQVAFLLFAATVGNWALPAFASRKLNLPDKSELCEAALDQQKEAREGLIKTLGQSKGPSMGDAIISSLARAYNRIDWEGEKPYWQSLKTIFDNSSDDLGNVDTSKFLNAKKGRVVKLFDFYKAQFKTERYDAASFLMKNPATGVICLYSANIGSDELNLVYRGIRSGRPIEIMQVRIHMRDRSTNTALELSGEKDNVTFDPIKVLHQVIDHIENHHVRLADVESIEILHNHPAEPFFYQLDHETGHFFPFDISDADVRMANVFQRGLDPIPVEITALIGLRPGMITRSTYSVVPF